MTRFSKTTIAIAASVLLLLTGLFILNNRNRPASAMPSSPNSLEKQLFTLLETGTQVDYAIHAFRIGVSPNAPRAPFINDPTLPKRIPVAFAVWMIEGGGRRILVDTGFVDKRMIKKWNITQYQSPLKALKNGGFTIDQITDVIITHRHWDHIGGLMDFEDANIWIPKITFKHLSKGRRFKRYFEDMKSAGRLNTVSKLTQVAPGVVMIHVGLHSPGCQMVVINKRGKPWVLAADTSPLFANYKRNKPTGKSTDPQKSIEMQKTILKWVDGDLGRIIPGHDPSVFNGKAHVVLTDKKSEQR